MAKIRLIADQPRTVPWLGGREVQPDEVVTVPDDGDFGYEHYVCQPETWQLIEEPKTAKAPAPKQRAASKDGE